MMPSWPPGEQVTAGLLAIVLQDMGIPARSWQGWQVPIVTTDAHGSARIAGIDGAAIGAGFAARARSRWSPASRASTARPAASRRSAAAARTPARWRSPPRIEAERCDIYTDVDGVYTTDPRIVPRARRLDRVAFEEMLEMASLGAKVLQVRSVELAMVHKVRDLRALVSFDDPADPQARHPHLRRGGHHGTAGRHRHRLLEGRGADHAARASPTSPASPPRSSCRWPKPTSMST